MYIQVSFPSGRYYAAEAHNPSSPEWPPHPSRLFSALVASAYRSGTGMTVPKQTALEWLEALPPPSIAAPEVDLSSAPVCYVPPGDSTGRKGKKGQEQYEHGVFRWGQPRHFPNAIILGEPVVYYNWQEDPEEDTVAALDDISAGVSHVGTSHSMAVVNTGVGQMPVSAVISPDPNGIHYLRAATPGRLHELETVYKQNTGVRRPTPACEYLASYRSTKERTHRDYASESEFISLRILGTMHGADTAAYLGRALRRAVMSVLGDDAPPAVHGHDRGNHVAWLPLPDVGHRYASGRIVGVGIMLPQDLEPEQRQKVLSGIGRVRDLRLPDGRIAQLSPATPGERLPKTLLRKTWTRSSRAWATVTPVVLDRPPKRLTEERVRAALCESLGFAGYPEPQEVNISTFSIFRGAPPAFRVRADKPRYHATVRFAEPIRGPVIAGRLRYFGVGLFRPLLLANAAGDN
ncbi:type I-U CRISPR-associated protein Csb2 [Thermodesulfobacteriota bacterium]